MFEAIFRYTHIYMISPHGQNQDYRIEGTMGSSYRQDSMRGDSQTFFKRIGARFGRIRKRPMGKPSPQLYQYKLWELQEFDF